MQDKRKTKAQLISELEIMRSKAAGLEKLVNLRRETSDASGESEARLRQAQQLARVGYWDWYLDTNALCWSDEVFHIFGQDPAQFRPTVESFEAAVHPGDLDAFKAERVQSLAENRVCRIEHRIIRPDGSIRWVRELAEIIRDDNGSVSRVMGAVQDITDHMEAEEKLKTSLKEKEVLLRELYHRTKNTMQVISSMLGIQASRTRTEEMKKLVEDTQNRIRAMSLVHQKLYQSKDLSKIDIKSYIEELAHMLMHAYHGQARKISLELKLQSMLVIIDTLIPCGLVLNELMTNSLKHAFPGNRQGSICIELNKPVPDKVKMVVSDNGIGVPVGFDFRSQDTFGLKTVIAIVENQMQGTVTFSRDNGITCKIEFPSNLYYSRV